MLFNTRRLILGAAILTSGIVIAVAQSTPGVAAEIPPDLVKALVDQDVGNIQKIADAGKFSKAEVKAARSNALMLAYYAQMHMGKDADKDKQLATFQAKSMKVATLLSEKKNYKNVAMANKELKWLPEADPKDKPVKADLAKEFDIGELMFQYRDLDKGGFGIEKDIKKMSSAKTFTAADAKKMELVAIRTELIADLSETITTALPNNAAKASWAKFNKSTKDAAVELAAAAKTGPAGAKKIAEALTKLDASCTACHNQFKK